MIDTFEHVLLFAICILIMRLSLPFTTAKFNNNLDVSYHEHPVTNVADAAIATSLAATMAVPLWVALEVIGWGINVLLN